MALNPLVSLFGRLVARSGRKRGNRQTDGRTDDRPTLAAHARRELNNYRGTDIAVTLLHCMDKLIIEEVVQAHCMVINTIHPIIVQCVHAFRDDKKLLSLN